VLCLVLAGLIQAIQISSACLQGMLETAKDSNHASQNGSLLRTCQKLGMRRGMRDHNFRIVFVSLSKVPTKFLFSSSNPNSCFSLVKHVPTKCFHTSHRLLPRDPFSWPRSHQIHGFVALRDLLQHLI
jgi:hypothetical protein